MTPVGFYPVQKSAYKLESCVLTAKECEHLTNELVKAEGVDATLIRKIVGKRDLFLYSLLVGRNMNCNCMSVRLLVLLVR